LRNVAAGDDEEESEVFHTSGEIVLVEEEDITDRRDDETDHAKSIAVLHAIRDPRRAQRRHGRNDEDGYGADLCGRGCVSEFLDDGGDEEGACVSRVDDAEIHECSEIDLWIAEDALCGALVHAVHDGVAGVGGEAGDEEGAFVFCQELCRFGPVRYLVWSVIV